MSVSAIINISQIDVPDGGGLARDSIVAVSSGKDVKDAPFSATSSCIQTHPPAVTQPAAAKSGSWQTPADTENTKHWSDSPDLDPEKLYRYRFAYGRDRSELFPQDDLGLIAVVGYGKRWGSLDSDSGVLTYQRPFSLSSSHTSLEIHSKNSATVLDYVDYSESCFSLKQLGKVLGDVTISIYPFLLSALPRQHSIKNSITTDIYIRIGNFTSVFDANSFKLFIDDALQPTLIVAEFFSGLGGFDVTWENEISFDYDAQVDVRWEFKDLSDPVNDFVISYPFYTAPDTSGPRVSNFIPGDLDKGVLINNSIQFDVEDQESGIDLDSLVIYVNNLKVTNGVTGTLTTSPLLSEKGYVVKYTPNSPWLYGDSIPVSIFIDDLSSKKNTTFYVYSFTTVESTPPRLINLKPLVCTITVPVGTHISADIIDGGHGLDKDSIVVSVEEKERTGQIILIPIIHRDE